jgi:hypothetical protein
MTHYLLNVVSLGELIWLEIGSISKDHQRLKKLVNFTAKLKIWSKFTHSFFCKLDHFSLPGRIVFNYEMVQPYSKKVL